MPTGDLALVDGLHDRGVAGVDLGVALEAGQPLAGGVLALEREDGADDRLEVRAAGGDPDPALPRGVGQVEHRGGQLVLGDLRRVVDRGRWSGRRTRPRCPTSGRYCSPTCSRVASSSGASSPALSTTSIDGLFSVRKTSAGEASPSCDDLVGQLGVVRVAELQLDAGLLGEALEHRADQALVLGAVDGQRLGVRAASPRRRRARRRRRRWTTRLAIARRGLVTCWSSCEWARPWDVPQRR